MAKNPDADATTEADAPTTDPVAAEPAAEDAPPPPTPTAPDADAEVDAATGADTTPPPENVEVASRTHVRESTSQSADLPIGVEPAVATPAIVPGLLDDHPRGITAGAVQLDNASDKQLAAFLRITGFRKSDVIGSSKTRRTFVTANGGKYELSPKGKKVRVLSGPTPPGPESTEEGDDE